MSTTIHVEQETRQILESIKQRENIDSLDQTIRLILLKSKETTTKSFFGIDKGKKITIERAKFHEI